jgi:predicted enzyme related to lactoylglutathione lyase
MGEVREYPNGTFCWIDLGTPEVSGAKAFYSALLGWETEDVQADEGDIYTICRLEGKDVAAIHEHPDTESAEWSSFISVDDVDATTPRARELGATVIMEPFDVMDAGRMSMLSDPTGATVSLWQSRSQIGARLVNEVGTWSWNELVTPDMDAARAFYGDLFGWRVEEAPGPIRRAGFTLGHLLVGGIHETTPYEGDASRWTVTFRVADAGQAVTRVGDLGGDVDLPPMEIPIGKFAIVTDPAGATFTVASFPGGALRGVDGS